MAVAVLLLPWKKTEASNSDVSAFQVKKKKKVRKDQEKSASLRHQCRYQRQNSDGNGLTQKGSSGPHSLSISVTAWSPRTRGEWFLFAQVGHFLAFPHRQKHDSSQPHAPNRRASHGVASGLSRFRGPAPEPDRRTERPVTGKPPRRLRCEAEVDREAPTGGCAREGAGLPLATPCHGWNARSDRCESKSNILNTQDKIGKSTRN